MILVVGSTGLLGLATATRLHAKGHAVRAMVREGSKRADAVRALGVPTVIGDLKDRGSLERACDGATCVITTATNMGSTTRGDTMRGVDLQGQLALVEAAQRAGVGRYVQVSVSPNLTTRAPLVWYKREVEQAVRASGIPFTILQPSAFMEIWLSPMMGWDLQAARVRISGRGENASSWISLDDVATFAVLAATDARLANRTVPLGGPEALSPRDVQAIAERVVGRPMKVSHLPLGVLTFARLLSGPFSDFVASATAMSLGIAKGDVVDMAPLLREFPVPMTTVEAHFRRSL